MDVFSAKSPAVNRRASSSDPFKRRNRDDLLFFAIQSAPFLQPHSGFGFDPIGTRGKARGTGSIDGSFAGEAPGDDLAADWKAMAAILKGAIMAVFGMGVLIEAGLKPAIKLSRM